MEIPKKKFKPKVIFIDWNGTLSDSYFWEHLRKSKSQEERNQYQLWSDAMFKDNKEMIMDWMRGKYTSEEMIEFVADRTHSDYEKVLYEFIKGCKSMSFSSAEIPDLVKALRNNGLKVVIATDNMDCFRRWTIPNMKLDQIFDHIINSYDVNGLKRDTDKEGRSVFFKDFFKKHSVEPKECIFIDDSEDRNNTISQLGIE